MSTLRLLLAICLVCKCLASANADVTRERTTAHQSNPEDILPNSDQQAFTVQGFTKANSADISFYPGPYTILDNRQDRAETIDGANVGDSTFVKPSATDSGTINSITWRLPLHNRLTRNGSIASAYAWQIAPDKRLS